MRTAISKVVTITAATAALSLAPISAAHAQPATVEAPAATSATTAGSWSGTGTVSPINIYNYVVVGSFINPPAGTSGTITSVNYEWNVTPMQAACPGSALAWLCAEETLNECSQLSSTKGTNTDFAGYPANTKFHVAVMWYNPKQVDGWSYLRSHQGACLRTEPEDHSQLLIIEDHLRRNA